jgi:hypothetical protein
MVAPTDARAARTLCRTGGANGIYDMITALRWVSKQVSQSVSQGWYVRRIVCTYATYDAT